MKIFINAGHWDDPTTDAIEDPGARTSEHNESELVMKIRDNLETIFPTADYVPDDLDLKQSIQYVNDRAERNDLAISIHINANNNTSIRGVEAYYADNSKLADLFSRRVSQSISIPNRGAKHDSESYVGSLGWLRKIKCQSVLIEVCYLTNSKDVFKIIIPSNKMKVARGIMQAINELRADSGERIKALQLRINQLIKVVLELIKIIIGLSIKK